MSRNLVERRPRRRLAALLVIAATLPPAFAAAEAPKSFCPTHYKLWGAICMDNRTGDVVRPRTRGPAYARIKAAWDGRQLCGAWDLHIATQIEDFALIGTVAADRLANAGQVKMIARTLCAEGRHAEAATVYESIFVGLD